MLKSLWKKISKNDKGFTLIEMMIVLMILSVLLLLVVPKLVDQTDEAKVEVCDANRFKLRDSYELHLVSEGKNHSDTLFKSFLLGYDQKLCPDDGVFSYVDGVVNCSVHTEKEDSEDDNEVPWL